MLVDEELAIDDVSEGVVVASGGGVVVEHSVVQAWSSGDDEGSSASR